MLNAPLLYILIDYLVQPVSEKWHIAGTSSVIFYFPYYTLSFIFLTFL